MTTAREVLQKLVPFSALSPLSLEQIIGAIQISHVDADEILFHEGDDDSEAIYLLQGAIQLSSYGQTEPRVISSGSDAARYAIAQLKPRHSTGTITKRSTIARIDQNTLDHIITMDEVSGIEVIEMDADEDVEWVFNVLSSTTFAKLPPANANQMLARMEKIDVKANQVVITQGETGDFYYLVREGTATIAKKDPSGTTTIVNELTAGDQFGEEALLSNSPRNATVMMKTDGLLMRLSRDDFNELLTEPILEWVDQAEANEMIAGGAELIDVRTAAEYRSGAINKSLNIPLSQIRQQAGNLDINRRYVIYCQTGSRSSVAAFLLNQQGFNAAALRGGLMDIIPESPE